MLPTVCARPGARVLTSGVVVIVIRTPAWPRASTRSTHTAVLCGWLRVTSERPLVHPDDFEICDGPYGGNMLEHLRQASPGRRVDVAGCRPVPGCVRATGRPARTGRARPAVAPAAAR